MLDEVLSTALPNITTPPHEPALINPQDRWERSVSSNSDVKMIGWVGVPTAMILAPAVTNRALAVSPVVMLPSGDALDDRARLNGQRRRRQHMNIPVQQIHVRRYTRSCSP